MLGNKPFLVFLRWKPQRDHIASVMATRFHPGPYSKKPGCRHLTTWTAAAGLSPGRPLGLIPLYSFLKLQPEMAPHASTLAWKIPWMEEPGRLQSLGLLRVGHNWTTSLSLFTFMHWRRKWQPTPVFLPGESQELGSLVGCHLWGCTESDTTEAI